MNLLFLGGLHYYRNPQAGHATEFIDLAGSLADMGHTVTYVEYDKPNLLERTARAARDLRPDAILYNPAEYEMDWAAFGALPYRKAVILSDDTWRRDYGLYVAQFVDYVLTTTPDGADVYGSKHIPFMWGVRKNRYHSLPPVEREHALMFVGMKHSNREAMIEALVKAGLKTYVAGHGWAKQIDGDKLPELLNTALVGLNATMSSVGNERQYKARLFEVPASGACLLTEYVDGLERYYTDGAEAVFWHDFDDLVNKAFWLLTHPEQRRAIAWAGMARTFQDHDYSKRWVPLLERLSQ